MQILAWEIAGLEAPGNLRLKRAGKSLRALSLFSILRAGYNNARGPDSHRQVYNLAIKHGKVILVERYNERCS